MCVCVCVCVSMKVFFLFFSFHCKWIWNKNNQQTVNNSREVNNHKQIKFHVLAIYFHVRSLVRVQHAYCWYTARLHSNATEISRFKRRVTTLANASLKIKFIWLPLASRLLFFLSLCVCVSIAMCLRAIAAFSKSNRPEILNLAKMPSMTILCHTFA